MPTGIYKRNLKSIKIGEKFNRLTVIKEIESHILPCGQKERKVLCLCECGNKKEIVYYSLKRKNTKSCGCLNKEINKNNKYGYKHGMRKTRFYNIWTKIKARCNNKNNKYYGGRGIKNEWKNFEEFKQDMYESYLEHCKKFGIKNTTIDRIDNNGNYCKNNCQWATIKIQNNNKRTNHLLTYQNRTLNITQWSEKLEIKRETLSARINHKWSVKKALKK